MVAAGAVLTSDIQPGKVAAGNPARPPIQVLDNSPPWPKAQRTAQSRTIRLKPGNLIRKAELPLLNPEFQTLEEDPGILKAESRSLDPGFKWLEAEFPPVAAE